MSISSFAGVTLGADNGPGDNMERDLLVDFRGVTKSFVRHAGHGLLRQTLQAFFSSRGADRFVALNNVSFTLSRGEGMAIVGRNGAGKSTLLSLVAGLSTPDGGSVCVRGRVGALLELGTGLHPDLTGRENLHLNAALMGLTRGETIEREPRMVEFAEIGDFIDEPLRTYSTGMMMRLAFAIAVYTSPDILIVDEVLAVGDARFQQKCHKRIQELRDEGCTFLFVSHVGGVVRDFCQRALWLDGGNVVKDGSCDEVLDAYEAAMNVSTTPPPAASAP